MDDIIQDGDKDKKDREKAYQREYYNHTDGKLHREAWRQNNPLYFIKWHKRHPHYRQEWREKRRENIRDYFRIWLAARPDYYRNYRKEHIEELRVYWRLYKRKQRQMKLKSPKILKSLPGFHKRKKSRTSHSDFHKYTS